MAETGDAMSLGTDLAAHALGGSGIWSVLKSMRGFARNKIGQGTDAAIARMLQQPAISFPGSRPLPPRGTGRAVGGALIPGRPGITGGRTAIGNLALLCGCL
jgi:hypothetical protein